jgi:hypothetical protein
VILDKITNNTCMVHSVFWLRLFLPQNLFIDMKTDNQALCCMSSVELYRFNTGGGLCNEWEKYNSVKLYLVLSFTVLI